MNSIWFMQRRCYHLIHGRVDKAFATEMLNLDSIPGRDEPKTIKIVIHSFLILKGLSEISTVCGEQVAARLEDLKGFFPDF